jgi:hypothetical protein
MVVSYLKSCSLLLLKMMWSTVNLGSSCDGEKGDVINHLIGPVKGFSSLFGHS